MSDTQKANDEGDLDLVLISALQDRYEFLSKYGVAGAHTEKALFSAIAAVHELIATKHKLAAMTKRAEEAERELPKTKLYNDYLGHGLPWLRAAYERWVENGGEAIEALQRKLDEAERRTVYKACPKHQGLAWNFMATVAMPAVEVCPHCEQDAARGKNG